MDVGWTCKASVIYILATLATYNYKLMTIKLLRVPLMFIGWLGMFVEFFCFANQSRLNTFVMLVNCGGKLLKVTRCRMLMVSYGGREYNYVQGEIIIIKENLYGYVIVS